MTTIMKIRTMVLAAALLVAGCGHKRVATPPPSYDGAGVHIDADKIEVDDEQLELRLRFVNRTSAQIVVDRDAMTLKLPSGSVVSRNRGRLGGATNAAYGIEPGEQHDVHVDFPIGSQTGTMALQLGQAVKSNGAPLALPDYVVVVPAN